MAWIARQHQRDQLANAQSFRMAQSVGDDFDAWSRDVELVTGVPRA